MFYNGSSNRVVPHEQKTIFSTFFKGYPVIKCEIRNFLVQNFGDCIESVSMEQVREIGDQPLFSQIVFFEVNIIYIILDGLPKAKFTINCKHVWMRKYVPKNQMKFNITPHCTHTCVVSFEFLRLLGTNFLVQICLLVMKISVLGKPS